MFPSIPKGRCIEEFLIPPMWTKKPSAFYAFFSMKKQAAYGIDAPFLVRNLFFFAGVAASLAILSFWIDRPLWFWFAFLYTIGSAAALFICGCWMLYGTRIAKPKAVSRLLDELQLKGDERVLDLGCGRGLLLIEAAKRLPSGNACGVDLWLSKDQSGNRIETTRENARIEGVEDRIAIQTADLRSLPFPDETFDAVVSSLAIHNIPDAEGRNKALSEMLRVLKIGGRFSLIDLHFGKDYAQFLNETQKAEAACELVGYLYCIPVRAIRGLRK